MTKTCPCCGEMFIGQGVVADVYSDGQALEYCSAECAEHTADEHQEYLDSYDVD